MSLLGLLGLYLALVAVLPALGRRLGTRVFLVAAVAPAATFAWLVTRAPAVLEGSVIEQTLGWVDAMGLSVTVRLDAFGLLMASLISGVGVLVFVYSTFYFGDRPDLGRFSAALLAFGGSMLGIVVMDNLLALFVFWELTSVTSYLLIGFEDQSSKSRNSAMQALLVTGMGGLAMIAGFVIIGTEAGTYSLSQILQTPPEGSLVAAGLLLVLLGAFTKSAQVPFHFWLPRAMAAPTPVSAYLHSATMVKAGVYLVARFAPAFSATFGFFSPIVMGVGVATMVLGGYRALRQNDLKLLLAFGTVSQLGFLMVLVGTGDPAITFAGVGMLLAHALFKATLFLVTGIIDHQAHTRDLRELSGVARQMPVVFATATITTLSMVGLPPTIGYLTKESAFEHLLAQDMTLIVAGIALATMLTVAYSARFLWGAFATKPPGRRKQVGPSVPRPATGFVLPAAVLALCTVALGLLPGPTERLVGASTRALDAAAGQPHLYLWHGFTPALGLAALTLTGGLALFAGRGRVRRLQRRVQPPVSAEGSYRAAVTGLNRGAIRVTGVVQNGSLPIYITVILATALAIPSWSLLRQGGFPSDLRMAESPLQALVVLAIAAAALACTMLKRRFAAVLMLGAIGFLVTTLFVIHGAPDLALTQLLIETLSLILFVLVLRHLPERFTSLQSRTRSASRAAVAVAVGMVVTGFALIAGNARHQSPVSTEHVARALPEGDGRNVVNVILTDFRALDTLGEVTVLVIAAVGVASLVTLDRRSGGD